ncbi:MAG TPA: metallophosphoesterase [Phycisphaerae bacterium]|nr:metallophosphoesterase [Phycisphaerae bacterium]
MRRASLWLVLGMVLAAGCTASVPRERITFAVLAGVYYSVQPETHVEAAMVRQSEALLRKAVADLNATKDLDFVVVAGDLLAGADGLGLDRAKAVLAELRVPCYVVLGEYDGPPLAATAPAEAEATQNQAEPPTSLSRSTVIWALQGRGFTGSEGYWSREVLPGLLLIGLDTVVPGQRGGHVDARQLAWLDRTLAAGAGKATLIVAHHGIVPFHPLDEGAAWQSMMVDNAKAVRDVLARHKNVLMVVAAHHHLAQGRVTGPIVYLSSPSVSVWPLAYHLVRLTPKEVEAVWIPLADDALTQQAQDRLLASPTYRNVFPAGEDGDTACIRLFGGNKMSVYPLPAIRP